jgi:hypothetical protein
VTEVNGGPLAEFLSARLDEDKHRAEGHWNRGLAVEVDAKRRIIALAAEATGMDMGLDQEFLSRDRDETAEPYLGDLILRALALPYAHHPDYREEWRP